MLDGVDKGFVQRRTDADQVGVATEPPVPQLFLQKTDQRFVTGVLDTQDEVQVRQVQAG